MNLEEQRVRALVDVMRNTRVDPQTRMNAIDELLSMCDAEDVAELLRPYVEEAKAAREKAKNKKP